jgi:putative transcriptional regulator
LQKDNVIQWDSMKTMIKYLRQELKMSQQELGDKVGVTRQTINSLENGRYNPSLFLARDITQVFNKMMFKGDREKYFFIEEIFLFDDDY